MGDRSALRLAVDLGFAAALVACGITVYAVTQEKEIPASVCERTSGGPRYDAMLADGRIAIAAVFAELGGGPADHNAWSYRAFAAALRERGFVETAPDRFEADALTIDIALVPKRRVHAEAAIRRALVDHDVIYYNGHSHGGRLAIDPPADYRVLVLDACWSTQYLSPSLASPDRDVIGNAERSITGSIESFLVVIDSLRARASTWPIAEMNALAVSRARARAPLTRFKRPERYRLDARCHGNATGHGWSL